MAPGGRSGRRPVPRWPFRCPRLTPRGQSGSDMRGTGRELVLPARDFVPCGGPLGRGYLWPTTEHRYISPVTTMVISGWGPAAAASTSVSEKN
jgi:hypothetical protein